MTSILIVSVAEDFHAYAVKWCIEELGGSVDLWVSTDFPESQTIKLHYGEQGACLSGANFPIVISADSDMSHQYDTIWFRRFQQTANISNVPAEDKKFAERETLTTLGAIVDMLSPSGFWVNNPDASVAANLKPRQLRLAAECGLKIPDTLISNSADDIRCFARKHSDNIIYKPLNPMTWKDSSGKHFILYTTKIGPRELSDMSVECTPGIFQPNLEKEYEIRATFIGKSVFSTKIVSSGLGDAEQDWRISGALGVAPRYAPTELPRDLVEKCHILMHRLGIVFGAFDFVVSPSGEIYFLEVNEMGQFLGQEMDVGLPVLETFSRFLMSGDPEFDADFTPNPAFSFGTYRNSDAFKSFSANPLQGHHPDKRSAFFEES